MIKIFSGPFFSLVGSLAKLKVARNTGCGMTLVTEFFLGLLKANPVVEGFLSEKKEK